MRLIAISQAVCTAATVLLIRRTTALTIQLSETPLQTTAESPSVNPAPSETATNALASQLPELDQLILDLSNLKDQALDTRNAFQAMRDSIANTEAYNEALHQASRPASVIEQNDQNNSEVKEPNESLNIATGNQTKLTAAPLEQKHSGMYILQTIKTTTMIAIFGILL